MTKPHPPKETTVPADELLDIYTSGGPLPDLTKLEREPKTSLRRILVRLLIILFGVSLVAWVGFFIWSSGYFTRHDTLEGVIEGPIEVAAGEEVDYTIRYENPTAVPLAALTMKLNLPLGFTLLSSVPPATGHGLTWEIGSLTAGSDGAITLRGVFRSEVPSTQTIQAFFTYRPGNYSSDFQTIKTLPVAINSSVLDLTVTGPAKAVAGESVTYTVNLRNDSDTPVSSAQLSLILPTGFVVASADPKPTAPDLAQWQFALLAPGEMKALTLKGSYTSGAAGEQTIAAAVGLLENGGVVLAQKEASLLTDVLGGTVVFHLIVDGNQENFAAALGEDLLISIDYGNNGQDAIADLSFILVIETPDKKPAPIDWSAATLPEGVRAGQTFTWDKTVVPEFASLNPNQTGRLDLRLPLLERLDPAAYADRFTLKLRAELVKIGNLNVPRVIENSPLTVALNSDLAAAAAARYYSEEGAPLGSGPLPPRVGQTTTYRVFWMVANSLHPLEKIRLSTNLPPDVAWVDQAQAELGVIEFNDTTRLLTWTIDALPLDRPEVGASFDLAITPNKNDVGSFFKLTNATAIEALDTVTKETLGSALDILTSELPDDAEAAGQGVVVE